MSSLDVMRSTWSVNLRRYARSRGVWLLMLIAPIGARFMVARDDGAGIQIAIGSHLPELTSAVLGISLGIVVSTLLLPVGFIYLRANITRRQPWQVEEVSAASRVARSLGRFGADVVVLFAVLVALTLAGCVLGLFVGATPLDPVVLAATLWVVAAPAVMGLAALCRVLDAVPWFRRSAGEVVFFVLWIASIAVALAMAGRASSFASNLGDFQGFVRPLTGPLPMPDQDFSIGSTTGILPGRVALDVLAGVQASGYLASRAAWVAIAILIAALAGAIDRPHTASLRTRRPSALGRWLTPGPPPRAEPSTPPARRSSTRVLGLVIAEFRLIGGRRGFLVLAALGALLGLAGEYRHVGSPAAALLLVFATTAHAGRSESRGLTTLVSTTLLSPWTRRLAFVIATVAWAIVLAVPAAAVRVSATPLLQASVVGGTTAIVAIVLAVVSRSAFAPRMVLLVLWYGYLSA